VRCVEGWRARWGRTCVLALAAAGCSSRTSQPIRLGIEASSTQLADAGAHVLPDGGASSTSGSSSGTGNTSSGTTGGSGSGSSGTSTGTAGGTGSTSNGGSAATGGSGGFASGSGAGSGGSNGGGTNGGATGAGGGGSNGGGSNGGTGGGTNGGGTGGGTNGGTGGGCSVANGDQCASNADCGQCQQCDSSCSCVTPDPTGCQSDDDCCGNTGLSCCSGCQQDNCGNGTCVAIPNCGGNGGGTSGTGGSSNCAAAEQCGTVPPEPLVVFCSDGTRCQSSSDCPATEYCLDVGACTPDPSHPGQCLGGVCVECTSPAGHGALKCVAANQHACSVQQDPPICGDMTNAISSLTTHPWGKAAWSCGGGGGTAGGGTSGGTTGSGSGGAATTGGGNSTGGAGTSGGGTTGSSTTGGASPVGSCYSSYGGQGALYLAGTFASVSGLAYRDGYWTDSATPCRAGYCKQSVELSLHYLDDGGSYPADGGAPKQHWVCLGVSTAVGSPACGADSSVVVWESDGGLDPSGNPYPALIQGDIPLGLYDPSSGLLLPAAGCGDGICQTTGDFPEDSTNCPADCFFQDSGIPPSTCCGPSSGTLNVYPQMWPVSGTPYGLPRVDLSQDNYSWINTPYYVDTTTAGCGFGYCPEGTECCNTDPAAGLGTMCLDVGLCQKRANPPYDALPPAQTLFHCWLVPQNASRLPAPYSTTNPGAWVFTGCGDSNPAACCDTRLDPLGQRGFCLYLNDDSATSFDCGNNSDAGPCDDGGIAIYSSPQPTPSLSNYNLGQCQFSGAEVQSCEGTACTDDFGNGLPPEQGHEGGDPAACQWRISNAWTLWGPEQVAGGSAGAIQVCYDSINGVPSFVDAESCNPTQDSSDPSNVQLNYGCNNGYCQMWVATTIPPYNGDPVYDSCWCVPQGLAVGPRASCGPRLINPSRQLPDCLTEYANPNYNPDLFCGNGICDVGNGESSLSCPWDCAGIYDVAADGTDAGPALATVGFDLPPDGGDDYAGFAEEGGFAPDEYPPDGGDDGGSSGSTGGTSGTGGSGSSGGVNGGGSSGGSAGGNPYIYAYQGYQGDGRTKPFLPAPPSQATCLYTEVDGSHPRDGAFVLSDNHCHPDACRWIQNDLSHANYYPWNTGDTGSEILKYAGHVDDFNVDDICHIGITGITVHGRMTVGQGQPPMFTFLPGITFNTDPGYQPLDPNPNPEPQRWPSWWTLFNLASGNLPNATLNMKGAVSYLFGLLGAATDQIPAEIGDPGRVIADDMKAGQSVALQKVIANHWAEEVVVAHSWGTVPAAVLNLADVYYGGVCPSQVNVMGRKPICYLIEPNVEVWGQGQCDRIPSYMEVYRNPPKAQDYRPPPPCGFTSGTRVKFNVLDYLDPANMAWHDFSRYIGYGTPTSPLKKDPGWNLDQFTLAQTGAWMPSTHTVHGLPVPVGPNGEGTGWNVLHDNQAPKQTTWGFLERK
jgi:hypothetical protein